MPLSDRTDLLITDYEQRQFPDLEESVRLHLQSKTPRPDNQPRGYVQPSSRDEPALLGEAVSVAHSSGLK